MQDIIPDDEQAAADRDQILQAAHDLITRNRVQVPDHAGPRRGGAGDVPTVYALVGGRDEVIAALMGAGADRFDAGIRQLTSRGLSRAAGSLELFADILGHEQELVSAVLASGALVSTGPEPLVLFRRGQVALQQAFTEAVEDGELETGHRPALAASTAARLGLGVVIDWVVARGTPDDLRADLLRCVAVVVGSLP